MEEAREQVHQVAFGSKTIWLEMVCASTPDRKSLRRLPALAAVGRPRKVRWTAHDETLGRVRKEQLVQTAYTRRLSRGSAVMLSLSSATVGSVSASNTIRRAPHGHHRLSIG